MFTGFVTRSAGIFCPLRTCDGVTGRIHPWYRNPLRIAKRRTAWKNDGVRILLSLTLLCIGLLPLQGALAAGDPAPAALIAFANYPDPGSYSGGGVPEGVNAAGEFGTSTDLRSVLTKILEAVFTILGIIAVLVIVIAGIYLLVGGGNDDTRQKAYKMILYAVIGLILILLAGAIVRWATTAL